MGFPRGFPWEEYSWVKFQSMVVKSFSDEISQKKLPQTKFHGRAREGLFHINNISVWDFQAQLRRISCFFQNKNLGSHSQQVWRRYKPNSSLSSLQNDMCNGIITRMFEEQRILLESMNQRIDAWPLIIELSRLQKPPTIYPEERKVAAASCRSGIFRWHRYSIGALLIALAHATGPKPSGSPNCWDPLLAHYSPSIHYLHFSATTYASLRAAVATYQGSRQSTSSQLGCFGEPYTFSVYTLTHGHLLA